MSNHTGYLLDLIYVARPAITPPWLAAPIKFNSDSEGWAVTGVIHGSKTSHQPVVEQPVQYAGSILPGFATDFYNRILIEPGIINVGNLVSDQLRQIKVFNGYFINKNLEALQIQDGDGIAIQGDMPPVVFGPLQTKTYNVTVTTNGPPSIDALLRFNFEGTADDVDVSILGSRITSLPYQAEAPFKETLEWKTQVIVPNNGTDEQRIRLRKHPRQSFAGTYPVAASEMQRALNITYGWLSQSWAINVWSEARPINGTPPGSTELLFDPTTADFRVGGLASVWQTARNNEVVEIESIQPDRLILKRGIAGSYSSAVVVPVRTGRADGSTTRRTSGYDGELSMTFKVQDNLDLSALAPTPPQFLGEDIYYDEAILPDDDVDDTLNKRVDITDYDTGPWDAFSPWKYTQISRPYVRVLNGAAELWAFRLWLHRRAGRLKPFWLPSFEADMRIEMTGLVTSSITVHADDYRNMGDDHTHIAIQLRDGTWYPRTITGTAIVDSELINVAIDSPLNVDASQLSRISYLALKRLDTDRIDINHRGGGVAVCTIKVLEIRP